MIAGSCRGQPAPTTGTVTLRPATALDSSRVLAWNGAAEVRARSLDPRPISSESHARWFAARLHDPRGALWIAVLDGCPIGVVRIDRAGHDGEADVDDGDRLGRISIVLDPSVRGRGLGRRIIALACAADGGPIVAEILADNHASLASFAAAGFVPEPAPPTSSTSCSSSSPSLAPGDARPVRRYLWRPLRVHPV